MGRSGAGRIGVAGCRAKAGKAKVAAKTAATKVTLSFMIPIYMRNVVVKLL